MTIAPPRLRAPGPEDHKYTRGKVVVVAGAMPGAAMLAACAAQRSGAGYVVIAGAAPPGPPHALVRQPWQPAALSDPRIDAVVVGPGLGLDRESADRLDVALATPHALVIDADALTLIARIGGVTRLRNRTAPMILTPHAGEFARLFGPVGPNRGAAALAAARSSGAIVILKGSETVIAAPDGAVVTAAPASPWLASAGTGDVLAGIVAAMAAQQRVHGFTAFAAATAAVWLHGEAARRAGPGLIADDLIAALPGAIAECLA